MTFKPEEVPILVLAGGLGSRLDPVMNDRPKVLAPVAGHAFIDILLEKLIVRGFRRFILSVGYKRERIYQHFEDHALKPLVAFSPEEIPLGTGGAIWEARRFLDKEPFLVLNGDSYCPTDYAQMIDCHRRHQGLCTLVLARVRDGKDYGNVLVDQDGRISGFCEKNGTLADGWVNAGIYLFQPALFDITIPGPAFSLERDLLPWLVGQFPVFGFFSDGALIDIGTPERLMRAQEYFRSQP